MAQLVCELSFLSVLLVLISHKLCIIRMDNILVVGAIEMCTSRRVFQGSKVRVGIKFGREWNIGAPFKRVCLDALFGSFGLVVSIFGEGFFGMRGELFVNFAEGMVDVNGLVFGSVMKRASETIAFALEGSI